MKPAPFDYIRAESVASCIQSLADASGDGKIIAGGQSLAPVLAMRLSRPSVLVDINRIPGLGAMERHDDSLSLGPLVRHADLVEQRHSLLLAEAGRWIGHPAIRSRGTLGGSISHSDPSAEWPVVASALEAMMTVAGPAGKRKVHASEFFLGALEPDLEPDEMLVGIEMPIPQTWGFAELSRRHGDFGLVTVVTALVEDRWRIAIGGIGAVPLRAEESEAILGDRRDDEAVRQAARAAGAAVEPGDDIHASKEYRAAMVEEFTHRSIVQALSASAAGVH
ncbi:FAD binding domain-containing protein [Nocardioides sp. NPDC047086]|uniref:FAD binding domain-containing protein n=1 Tax=Nocardioides sp. NPDC047086 TaxID=3154810 RepID=UPI0033F196B5